MRIQAKLRIFVNKLLISTGFQIVRSNDYLPFKRKISKKLLRSNYMARLTNDFLIRFGDECDYLIDVGANRGSFCDHFRIINPNAKCILIEPIPTLSAFLTNKYDKFSNIAVVRKAVSNEESVKEFHITANDGQSSSLLNIGLRHLAAAPHAQETERIEVVVSKLDSILDLEKISRAFLKIDVQGNEIKALLGATSTLKKVSAIHIEVSIQSLYDGDSIGFKVWEFLDNEGFVLYGIDPWFRDPKSNGELLQADLFFVKRESLIF
jgi:FkbM family methyltransferase